MLGLATFAMVVGILTLVLEAGEYDWDSAPKAGSVSLPKFDPPRPDSGQGGGGSAFAVPGDAPVTPPVTPPAPAVADSNPPPPPPRAPQPTPPAVASTPPPATEPPATPLGQTRGPRPGFNLTRPQFPGSAPSSAPADDPK
jgi:hypothetical protein